MAGYFGYSMSNNAVASYEQGQKPLSKWTKKEMLELIKENNESIYKAISKLTVKELKDNVLSYEGWHHTSKFYNKTEFYSFDEDTVKEMTIDDIEKIINSREVKVKIKLSQEEFEKKMEEEKARFKAKRIKEEKKEFEALIKNLFKFQTKYKTVNGLLKYCLKNSEYVEVLKASRKEMVAAKRENLRKNWIKQNYEYGLQRINDDDYIASMYF